MNYQPALEDINFILHDVLNAPAQLQALPAFSSTDADLMRQVADPQQPTGALFEARTRQCFAPLDLAGIRHAPAHH